MLYIATILRLCFATIKTTVRIFRIYTKMLFCIKKNEYLRIGNVAVNV